MSKPATDARLAAAANGFSQVIGRGDASIVTKNPTTGRCCVDAQVGAGWHYNGEQETDTAWEQDADQNYLKMVKALYNVRARKLFNAGNLLTWTDPVSGKYVTFQPQQLQWIDAAYGSNSVISVAQSISAPTVTDDNLYWPSAFGPKRHFRYVAGPVRLSKYVEIEAGGLPACPAYTNPYLELTFTLTPSDGLTLYVDGVAWDNTTAKTTSNAIEFRLATGEVVWSFASPRAIDANGDETAGIIKLHTLKRQMYCSVRFPKSWVGNAAFPIVLDPTVDYQVGASADDGYWYETFASNTANLKFGGFSGSTRNIFCRWTGVTIPVGATVDVAYLSFEYYASSGTPPACTLYFEDAANPAAPTTAADANGRTKTTASISVTGPTSGTWWNTSSIKSIIDELIASYNYSGGAAMQMLLNGVAGSAYSDQSAQDTSSGTLAPKLHIEYTEAASAKAQVIFI